MKSVQLSLSTILLQYRQCHHILLEYVTAVDIGDPNQQKVEFIDEDKEGAQLRGEVQRLRL
jgi:hypothetical protein